MDVDFIELDSYGCTEGMFIDVLRISDLSLLEVQGLPAREQLYWAYKVMPRKDFCVLEHKDLYLKIKFDDIWGKVAGVLLCFKGYDAVLDVVKHRQDDHITVNGGAVLRGPRFDRSSLLYLNLFERLADGTFWFYFTLQTYNMHAFRSLVLKFVPGVGAFAKFDVYDIVKWKALREDGLSGYVRLPVLSMKEYFLGGYGNEAGL